jgi:hypothetical protein
MPTDNTLTDNKRFTSRKLDWIEHIISDQRLTDLQKVVAVALSFYFNRGTDGGYVKQKVLAKKVGCSRRAVQLAIDALAEAGHISVEIGTGEEETNIYTMLNAAAEETISEPDNDPPCESPFAPHANPRSHPPGIQIRTPCEPPFAHKEPVQEPVQTPVQETCAEESPSTIDSSRGAVNVPMIINIENTITTESQTGFDQFWQIFPRKVAKGAALKAYTRIIKSKHATESELLSGAIRYAQEQRGADPRYVKHPATWLNGWCWQDQPQMPARLGKITQADTAAAGFARFLNRGAQ